ncbi:MAG: peptidoglycan editing factor PgeF [bacterium]|nr:peptidoglycan editing factor PgeF [bacterium]
MLRHPGWTWPGLHHGFLGRAAAGADGWDAAAAAAGMPLPVVTARQVHGTAVVEAARWDERPPADAVVTGARGLLVGVVTADCTPVLLVDPQRRLAAAVHAGWRGAAAGVVEAAIEALRARFAVEPGDLHACLGPTIGGCCYQVGAEVREAFVARTGERTAAAWQPDGDRHRLDLRAAVTSLLHAAGVGDVVSVGPCTACDAGWYSYRRDGAGAGRQVGVIGWA